MEAREDILERFTDPTKKRKRKEKKEEAVQQKCSKICNDGKLFAVDFFNTPPTKEDVVLWETQVILPLPEIAMLEQLLVESHIDMINYTPLARLDGLFCVLDFLSAADHCSNWLEKSLQKVGWKRNMTSYHPVSVSHSSKELLSATLECYKMSIKQMILLQTQRDRDRQVET